MQAFADGRAAAAFAAAIQPILNNAEQEEVVKFTRSHKETSKMKIAIPTAGGRLCMHFGHCEQFALVEVDQSSGTILKTWYMTPPAHEPGVLPRWLHEQGVNTIIAGGMGQRAQGLFAQNGIKVLVGAPGETPEVIVAAYLSGTLQVGENICDH